MKRISRKLLLASSGILLVTFTSTAINAKQVALPQPLDQIASASSVLPRIELLPLDAIDAMCQQGTNSCLTPGRTQNASVEGADLNRNSGDGMPTGNVTGKSLAYRFNAGDKIKFSFYDRDDLTGVYKVRLDGTVSLPFLGNFVVIGKSAQKLENEISSALTRLTKRPTFLSIEAIERRPFYIVGTVNKAGQYAYVPNMNVLHALALAGGTKTTGAITTGGAQGLQLTREVWKRKRAMKSLQRSLAKLSRLEAERNGLTTLVPTERLVALVGQIQANQIIEQEKGLFAQRLVAKQRRTEDLKQMETLSREELKAYRNQLAQIRIQEQQHKAEFKDLRNLAKRGLTRRTRVYAKSNDISELQGQASEVMAAIARASRAIVRAQRDLTMLPLDRQRKIEEEIQAVTDRIDIHEGVIQASSDAIGDDGAMLQLTGLNSGALVPKIRYSLIRPTNMGYQTIEADEYTRVLPGDILRVKREFGGSALGGGTGTLEAKLYDGMRSGPGAIIRTSVGNDGRVTGLVRTGHRREMVATNEIGNLRKTVAQMSAQLSQLTAIIQNKLGGKSVAPTVVEDKNAVPAAQTTPNARSIGAKKIDVNKPLRPIKYIEPSGDQAVAPKSGGVHKPLIQAKAPVAAMVLASVEAPARKPEPQIVALDKDVLTRQLQTQLMRVGCSPSYVDGIWGRKSRAALRAFNQATSERLNVGQPGMTDLAVVKGYRGRACNRQYASR